jgi:ATP diphosphatase
MNKKRPYTIDDLVYLMARLRSPENGCPWDRAQDYQSIVPYTLEEVYEVVDTIERGDYGHLGEELGDLLFQVVFYARLAEEEGHFDFPSVVDGIVGKLISRHPHVFPDGTLGSTRPDGTGADETRIKETWEDIKRRERTGKGMTGHLADIPVALPALSRAQKVQKRAAKHGFDWQQAGAVIDKIREEMEELEIEMAGPDRGKLAEEMGDLLFACVNMARHLGLDAEATLRRATSKFERRYRDMESFLEQDGREMENLDPETREDYWRRAKSAE